MDSAPGIFIFEISLAIDSGCRKSVIVSNIILMNCPDIGASKTGWTRCHNSILTSHCPSSRTWIGR